MPVERLGIDVASAHSQMNSRGPGLTERLKESEQQPPSVAPALGTGQQVDVQVRRVGSCDVRVGGAWVVNLVNDSFVTAALRGGHCRTGVSPP